MKVLNFLITLGGIKNGSLIGAMGSSQMNVLRVPIIPSLRRPVRD